MAFRLRNNPSGKFCASDFALRASLSDMLRCRRSAESTALSRSPFAPYVVFSTGSQQDGRRAARRMRRRSRSQDGQKFSRSAPERRRLAARAFSLSAIPKGREREISEGFSESHRKTPAQLLRGESRDLRCRLLESQGIAANTGWGVSVAKHMSVPGTVVNGNRGKRGGHLDREYALDLFSRARVAEEKPRCA